eukprot:4432547-Ditylum_brightwellii.AAC.1
MEGCNHCSVGGVKCRAEQHWKSNKMGGPSNNSQELLRKNLRELSMVSVLLGVLHVPCDTGVPAVSSMPAAAATH